MSSPSLLRAMLRQELRIQWRTTRFRLAALLYLALTIGAPILLAVRSNQDAVTVRTVSYLSDSFQLLPFATVLLSLLIVGNTALASGRELLLISAPVSNAGFVIRTWLIQTALVLAISALAVCGALLVSVFNDPSRMPIQQAAGKWLVLLVPRAMVSCAGWLGAVLLLRSEVAALFATTLIPRISTSLLNQLTFRRGIVLDEFQWLEFRAVIDWLRDLFQVLSSQDSWYLLTPASDADFPVAAAFRQLSTYMILPTATALIFLAMGIAHLGRCQADVPVLKWGQHHPLRNFGRRFQNLRESLRSDDGLTLMERGVRASLALAAIGLLGAGLGLAHFWHVEAQERYQAETRAVYQTTPRSIVPGLHKISGEIDSDGRIRFDAEIVLGNQGAEPVAQLAFELAPEIELVAFEAEGHLLTHDRTWDRLEVQLEPPLPAGQGVTLRASTAGRPVEQILRLRRMSSESFAAAFERHRLPSFPRDVSPLLHSRSLPLVSARRTLLPLRSILPQLRYASWQLTAESSSVGGRGREVPAESHNPVVDFDLEVTVPTSWTLIDSCGQVGGPERVLRSLCSLPFTSFALAGGERVVLNKEDGLLTVAALPQHAGIGRRVFEALDRIASSARDLTPATAKSPTAITALEMPTTLDRILDQRSWSIASQREEASTLGRLILLPESRLLRNEPLATEQLVSSVLLHDLAPRYSMPPDDRRAFLALNRALLLARSGLEPASAVITTPAWARFRIYGSLLHSSTDDPAVWQVKVPAILRDLETRVGRPLLFETFQSFLRTQESAPSTAPSPSLDPDSQRTVTLPQIFSAVGKRAGIDLDTFYDDFIAGGALPALGLNEIETRREFDRYVVSGQLTNQARGHATCQISVKTAHGDVGQTVTVGPRSSEKFEISTFERPFTVTLDPDGTCFRLKVSFVPDSVPLINT